MVPTMSTFFFSHNVYENLSLRPADLQGWQVDSDAYTKLVKEMRPSVIIEVGVWKGCTTIGFAEAMKAQNIKGKVLAVDTWLGALEFWTKHIDGVDDEKRDLQCVNGFPSVYYTFLSNVVHRGVQDYVIPLPMPSTMAAALVRGKSVVADVVHVDASHEYKDVLDDLRAWWPLLRAGGVFLLDDYTNPFFPGVRKAVDEFAREVKRPVTRYSNLKHLIRK